MKLNRDVIEGIVEEELAEMKVRKAIRNQISEIDAERQLENDISAALNTLGNALKTVDRSISSDNRFIFGIVEEHFDEIKETLESHLKG